jgi:hypothetical protein
MNKKITTITFIIGMIIFSTIAFADIKWQKQGVGETMNLTDSGNLGVRANVTATYYLGNGSLLTDIQATGIADDSITSSKIADANVQTNDIADGNVTNAKIDSVAASKITGTIGDSQIASGIDAAKIGSGNISNTEYEQLNGVTSNIQNQIDGKLNSAGGTIIGDLQINGNLTVLGTYINLTIQNQIINGSFRPELNNTFDLGNQTNIWKTLYVNTINITGQIAGALNWNNLINIPSIISSIISAGGINTSHILDGNVTDAKIDSVSASKITGTISDAQVANDITINSTSNIITTQNITANYILGNGSLLTDIVTTIADGSITSSKIADGNVNPIDVNSSATFDIAGANVNGNLNVSQNLTIGSSINIRQQGSDLIITY